MLATNIKILVPAGASFGRPEREGFYARFHALGATVDYWDGKIWRRPSGSHQVDAVARVGVVCANQNLAWRALAAGELGRTRAGEPAASSPVSPGQEPNARSSPASVVGSGG